jgi:hypothetical protein
MGIIMAEVKAIIFKQYRELATEAQAAEWFGILPRLENPFGSNQVPVCDRDRLRAAGFLMWPASSLNSNTPE